MFLASDSEKNNAYKLVSSAVLENGNISKDFFSVLQNTFSKRLEKQYRKDRAPAGEPLLTFKRGALVHFALDQDNVSMTTRLQNGSTWFLPFNRGASGGAGNPDIEGEFRIAYLYANQPSFPAIFSRETLLDIVGGFLHLQKDKDTGKESLIFPRFHQLNAVVRLMSHAKQAGPGQSYLVQHSAGSGRSGVAAPLPDQPAGQCRALWRPGHAHHDRGAADT